MEKKFILIIKQNAFLFYAILPLLSISKGGKKEQKNLTVGKIDLFIFCEFLPVQSDEEIAE